MKGYFSQLIEQTGITFDSSESVQHDQLTENPEDPELLHIEETEVIIYLQEQQGEKTSENLEETEIIEQRQDQNHGSPSGDLARDIEETEIMEQQQDQKREIPSDSPLNYIEKIEIIESQQDKFQDGSHITVNSEPEKKESKKEPDKATIEFSPVINKKPPDRIQDFQKGDAFEKDEIREAAGNVYNQKSFRQAQQKDDELNTILFKSEQLKHVRKWVAGNTPDTIKIESQEGKVIQGEKETERQFIPVIYDTKQKEAPDIQDFNLSIGTISLTIEEPQKEIRKIEPPQPANVERPSSRESSSSRLSRHYIRII